MKWGSHTVQFYIAKVVGFYTSKVVGFELNKVGLFTKIFHKVVRAKPKAKQTYVDKPQGHGKENFLSPPPLKKFPKFYPPL